MKRFRDLKQTELSVTDLKLFLAHDKPRETLEQHAYRVYSVFLSLCDEGLEEVINGQIRATFPEPQHDTIKQLIVDILYYHDIGKINPAFQKKLGGERTESADADSTHSKLGWILFSLAFHKKIVQLKDEKCVLAAEILTTAIAGHHTYAWGSASDNSPQTSEVERSLRIAREQGWLIFPNDSDETTTKEQIVGMWDGRTNNRELPQGLFSLYKTVYSTLILSDSVATALNGEDRGPSISVITQEDVERWQKHFNGTQNMVNTIALAPKLSITAAQDIQDLNELRSKILLEATSNLHNGLSKGKRIFYLEAPTGSGKTNCSINLALEILSAKSDLKHLIYVFPYVNLIEQNTSVIRDAIGALPEDVLEVHSLSDWTNTVNDEKLSDEQKLSVEYDRRLFLNGKINTISNVGFIEALGSSRKKPNYRICSLSNSVIIIDELQSIDDRYWTYLEFLLDRFAAENNCYILLMSATLPRVDKIGFTSKKCDFIELLPSPKEYQNHPSFSGRTEIILKDEIETTEQLITLVKEILRDATQKPIKLLIVVNTIKRSREVFVQLQDNYKTSSGHKKFKKYLLHSELLPYKKIHIIRKSCSKKSTKNLILVSTQCIEAGIDADFDIGIRDYAILDSIEQVAGRINREGKKKISKLFIINLKRSERSDSENIYGSGRRWQAAKQLKIELPDILRKRDYERYYKKLIEITQMKNRAGSGVGIPGRNETKNAMSLRFSSKDIKEFSLIKEMPTTSYFLPIKISTTYFSKSELKQIHPDAVKNNEVDGKQIWEQYDALKKHGGREGMLKTAAFSSILSKFIAKKKEREASRMNDGIVLCEDWPSIYNLQSGFIDSDNIF